MSFDSAKKILMKSTGLLPFCGSLTDRVASATTASPADRLRHSCRQHSSSSSSTPSSSSSSSLGSFTILRCAAATALLPFPKCISPAIIEPLFESIIDVVETANNTGRLEDGMIIMKFLLPILLILEQGIFPVRGGARA